jgi:hypothetical protein
MLHDRLFPRKLFWLLAFGLTAPQGRACINRIIKRWKTFVSQKDIIILSRVQYVIFQSEKNKWGLPNMFASNHV